MTAIVGNGNTPRKLAVRPQLFLISSWLNLVDRSFGEITRDRIRRGTFESGPTLVAAIEEYLQQYNAPHRFFWTKDVDNSRQNRRMS